MTTIWIYSMERNSGADGKGVITEFYSPQPLIPAIGDSICWKKDGYHWRGKIDSRVYDFVSQSVELWVSNVFRISK